MGNSVSAPTPTNIPFTTYKQCIVSAADAYMQQVLSYNTQFSSLASWDGAQVRMAINPAQLFYNPPRPAPWVSSQVDVFFEQDILTYNAQLRRIAEPANRLNQRMVKVINTPPVPPPAPEYILLATGATATATTPGAVPSILPNPQPEPAPKDPPLPPSIVQGETDVNRLRYLQMYLLGQQYVLFGQVYNNAVKYSPPAAGAPYNEALKHFMILYEQIRGLHALNTGGEVFGMKFIAPLRKEGFANPPKCIDVNSMSENWYFNQVIDIQGKRDLQQQFCLQKGLQYDASNCGIRQCVQLDTFAYSEDIEPDTGKLYNYNQIQFSADKYPTPIDNTAYQRTLELNKNLQLQDIDTYYKKYNAYNFFWRDQHGWRNADKEKPYNPPIAPWIRVANPLPGDKVFLDAVTAFNARAVSLIADLNSYKAVDLPTDFGEFPEPPPYPNELYETLKRPTDFVRPAAASSVLVSNDPIKQKIQYQIPINEVPEIYNALKITPRAPPPPPAKPKCADNTGDSCILYDDEVSDAAKKVLADMDAKRIQSASIQYAITKPKVVNDIIDDKLSDFYNVIRPDIFANIQSLLRLK